MDTEKQEIIVYLDFRETEYGIPLYDGTACPDSLASIMANNVIPFGPNPVEFDTTNARIQNPFDYFT